MNTSVMQAAALRKIRSSVIALLHVRLFVGRLHTACRWSQTRRNSYCEKIHQIGELLWTGFVRLRAEARQPALTPLLNVFTVKLGAVDADHLFIV